MARPWNLLIIHPDRELGENLRYIFELRSAWRVLVVNSTIDAVSLVSAVTFNAVLLFQGSPHAVEMLHKVDQDVPIIAIGGIYRDKLQGVSGYLMSGAKLTEINKALELVPQRKRGQKRDECDVCTETVFCKRHYARKPAVVLA